MINLIWIWKSFSELTSKELYNIIAAREEVFIVEQGLNYLDCDGLDLKAYHLVGLKNDKVVAYLRAFPPGVKYPEASLGRVLNLKEVRGKGIGKELIRLGIENIQKNFGQVLIKISAQSYLKNFYEGFGFKIIGEEYLEEGIPHYKMIRYQDIP